MDASSPRIRPWPTLKTNLCRTSLTWPRMVRPRYLSLSSSASQELFTRFSLVWLQDRHDRPLSVDWVLEVSRDLWGVNLVRASALFNMSVQICKTRSLLILGVNPILRLYKRCYSKCPTFVWARTDRRGEGWRNQRAISSSLIQPWILLIPSTRTFTRTS